MKLVLQLPGPNPFSDQFRELLQLAGYEVVTAESLLGKDGPDMVLLDKATWLDLSKRASDDFLTSTLNRGTFFMKAEGEILHARDGLKPVCCLLLDLDFFKSVNDTYGHTIGDLVLKTAASVLKSACREKDLVGRYGGEEFAVLLINTTLQEAQIAAERIRSTIEQTSIETHKGTVKITASIGVAQLGFQESLESLIYRADVMLYNAKFTGRNQVHTDERQF